MAEVEAVQLCLALQIFMDHFDVVPCDKYCHQKRALETGLWNFKCTVAAI